MDADRFWSQVDKSGRCWMWTGSRGGDGYGLFNSGGRLYSAHRLAYQLAVGTIPTGLVIMHECDNRACVNPAHLKPGTHAENMQDKVAKGRVPKQYKVRLRQMYSRE